MSGEALLQGGPRVDSKGPHLSDCQEGTCGRLLPGDKSKGDVGRRRIKEQQILAGCLARLGLHSEMAPRQLLKGLRL